ncbi:hypothetical protein HYH02_001214 [Chlamydomonas schloesseri]|uniref:Pherophorin domain-containing protein n=1 Tax=Chlamydomonas schloesseri TaxID=2026947 RepID=A0A836BCW9_9CHLO|nr:hypothetical protein HYH02_001214 [Chlamydomonas schloesseri]|eukprot:KAG2454179.1 hypothetical protein HYH02_001214 [Chlamydomonas schloesseri]
MKMATRSVVLVAMALLCLGAVSAARTGAKGAVWPALSNCQQKADTTAFRVKSNTTTALPGNTVCFGFSAVSAPSGNCGKATTLERVAIWASHASRTAINGYSIRTATTTTAVSGTWAKKGDSSDELTFSKLGWTAQWVAANSPRICLTLDHDVTLDDICVGKKCVVALYSVGAKNAKCCPVYQI